MYRKVRDNQNNVRKDVIYRETDTTWIPTVTDNRDFQEFQAWSLENNIATIDDLEDKED